MWCPFSKPREKLPIFDRKNFEINLIYQQWASYPYYLRISCIMWLSKIGFSSLITNHYRWLINPFSFVHFFSIWRKLDFSTRLSVSLTLVINIARTRDQRTNEIFEILGLDQDQEILKTFDLIEPVGSWIPGP